MATNADWTIIAGTGSAHIAPVGTTLPAGPSTALNASFADVGHIGEDGVAVSFSRELGEWASLQSAGEYIRREVQRRNRTFALAAMELNLQTAKLAWEAEASAVTGGVKLTLPEPGDAIQEFSAVIEIEDGDRVVRFVIERANVVEDTETTFARSDPATWPLTIGALTPAGGGASVVIYDTNVDAYDLGA